jgi:hypothetical protein
VTIQGEQGRFNDTWISIGFPIEQMPGVTVFEGLTFSTLTGTILGYDESQGVNVVIPATINGVAVKSIGDRAFQSKGIESVVFPEGLERIGQYAFSNNQLKEVNLPNSVTFLGGYAFQRNSITTIQFSNQLTSITTEAFAQNALKILVIPEWITEIGWGAFSSNQLESVSFPSTLRSIGSRAFRFNQLKTITIPAGVISISSNTPFANNPWESVTIQGEQGRFNDTWISIGFPIELLPNDED